MLIIFMRGPTLRFLVRQISHAICEYSLIVLADLSPSNMSRRSDRQAARLFVSLYRCIQMMDSCDRDTSASVEFCFSDARPYKVRVVLAATIFWLLIAMYRERPSYWGNGGRNWMPSCVLKILQSLVVNLVLSSDSSVFSSQRLSEQMQEASKKYSAFQLFEQSSTFLRLLDV